MSSNLTIVSSFYFSLFFIFYFLFFIFYFLLFFIFLFLLKGKYTILIYKKVLSKCSYKQKEALNQITTETKVPINHYK
jgi:hypothetical protein